MKRARRKIAAVDSAAGEATALLVRTSAGSFIRGGACRPSPKQHGESSRVHPGGGGRHLWHYQVERPDLLSAIAAGGRRTLRVLRPSNGRWIYGPDQRR